MNRTLGVVLIAAFAAVGCVERAPELTAAEREQLGTHVTREAPQPQHALDVQFENGIRLIGYDVDVESVTPGQPFTVSWYWRVDRRLEGGWQAFTHLADGRGENRINQDSEGVVRQLYPPSRWREGDFIRDEQRMTIPTDWNSDRVVFYLGLWNGPHRLAVSSGPNDGENRVRAASLPVATAPSAQAAPPAERPQTPPPSLRADHAGTAIAVDGRTDEAAWGSAPASSAFVNTLNGAAADVRATAKVLWDDTNLYVAVDVADTDVRHALTARDAHLWEQDDAVELMLDPDGDGRNYFELQVSPAAVVFDTRYDSRRVPGPIGHADWNAAIEARTSVRGTANDATPDEGYTVELALPWASLLDAQGQPLTAPAAGSTFRMNLYVMDAFQGGSRSAGWSPTLESDFHVPARFGRVTFAAPPANVVAAGPGAAVALPRLQLPARALRQLQGRVRPTPAGLEDVRAAQRSGVMHP